MDFSIREDEFEKLPKEEFDYAITFLKNLRKQQKPEIISKIEKNLKKLYIDQDIYKLDLALLCLIIN